MDIRSLLTNLGHVSSSGKIHKDIVHALFVGGKLALKDYTEYAHLVGNAYLAQPEYDTSVVSSWDALAKHTEKMFQQLLSRLDIQFTEDDPYKSFKHMKKAVEKSGKLNIWTGNSKHPVWTEEQNWKFRAVHDGMIHLAGVGHKFSLRGELGAYNRHYKIAPPAARDALFTEIVGQICTFYHLGKSFDFSQKVCKLHGFDYGMVGKVDEKEYQKNFS